MKALIRRLCRYISAHRQPMPDHFSAAMEALIWAGPTR